MLVFDMDGTLNDFYQVNGWLEDLRNASPRPYEIASPRVDMVELKNLLNQFRANGWIVAITSWLAKDSSAEYSAVVRDAKRAWLARYEFPADEIHIVKYGRTKADSTRKNGGYQILIDDNAKVRAGWHLGDTIDANKNFLEILKKVIDNSAEL
jgi:phosphoglycolate phosphatase-like HAD superfamily hydrolase